MGMGTHMEVMATDIGTEKGVLMLNLALTPMLIMVTGVMGTATLTMVTDMAITWVSEALMPMLMPNLTMDTGLVTDILIMVTDMAIIWANEVPKLMPMVTIPAITGIPIVMAMAVTMAVTGAKLTDHFSLLTLILITLISEHKKIFCLLPWLSD